MRERMIYRSSEIAQLKISIEALRKKNDDEIKEMEDRHARKWIEFNDLRADQEKKNKEEEKEIERLKKELKDLEREQGDPRG